MLSKLLNGTEFLQKTLSSDPDLEILGPRKASLSVTSCSLGISYSSSCAHPPIPLGFKETARNLKLPTSPSASSVLWSPRTVMATACSVAGHPKGERCATSASVNQSLPFGNMAQCETKSYNLANYIHFLLLGAIQLGCCNYCISMCQFTVFNFFVMFNQKLMKA